MKLSAINSKRPHSIIRVEESDLKYRLYEMGIYPNQELQMINKAPLGDPIVVQVDGQLIMLRLDEAELITLDEKQLN